MKFQDFNNISPNILHVDADADAVTQQYLFCNKWIHAKNDTFKICIQI